MYSLQSIGINSQTKMCIRGFILVAIILNRSCRSESMTANKTFLVDLPDCRIPESPLFPEEVKIYWGVSYHPFCPALPNVGVISPDKILSLDPVSVKSRNITECWYKEILRPQLLKSDRYTLSNRTSISESIKLNISAVEFLFINCTTWNGTAAGHILEYHHNIPKTKPEIEEKLKFWADKKDEEKPMDMMFVIIDSVSRAHALRSLPKTMKYLTENAGFVDFKGYHCVGEPSSVNYIPMTLGLTGEDLLQLQRRSVKGHYDEEPFLHKNFSKSHYVTMEVEDMAFYNVFNYNGRSGFAQKPFDFYLRPYMLVREEESHEKIKHCVNDKHIFDFLMDYTLEFIETYSKIPKYTSTYFNWPNHDKFCGTRVMDTSFLNLFRQLDQIGALNNTIVFVVADHGYRYATKYSESKYGLLERNLPMFLVKLPERFITKYPGTYKNLVNNAKKLTSHFDLFKTVAHLHQLMLGNETSKSYGYNMEYGRSLLQEIPDNRTCPDAKIPERFCSCNFPLFETEFNYEKFKKRLTG